MVFVKVLVHSTVLDMIEKWKKSIDQRKNAGALLTDLSKAFDCMSHNLLIAKLEAYGVDTNSLYIIHSYLTNLDTNA